MAKTDKEVIRDQVATPFEPILAELDELIRKGTPMGGHASSERAAELVTSMRRHLKNLMEAR